MASRRYALLAAILITICLDVSFIIATATAAAVVWNPKTSKYVGSYNLDKGPVFYEAYYPDAPDAYQKKRYIDRNTMFETSFQVPLKRLAYSAETADHPVSITKSLVVADDNMETSPREREAIDRNYDATSQLASFPNERLTIFDNDKNSQITNIEEISKLVRRAISRDLENWNALEGYLDRTVHQDQPMPQPEMYSRKNHKNEESGGYIFPVNRKLKDSSEQSNLEALLPRKLNMRDAKHPPQYLEGANASTMTSEMNFSETTAKAVDIPPSIDVLPDPLPPENIFLPRPQLIRYTFFKRPVPSRLDERKGKTVDESTPWRSHGNNLIREEIADQIGRRVKENVKVTSIEISELPRHRTRHHHGEWPQRDYSRHRHRSQPTTYLTVS